MAEEPAEEPADQMAAEEEAPPADLEFLQVQEEAQFLANDEVIGTDVLNDMDEKVGTIADLVMDQDQKLVGVVLSVGGFLGIGDKWVAVPVEQIDFPSGDQPARLLVDGHRGAADQCARLHDARRRSRPSRVRPCRSRRRRLPCRPNKPRGRSSPPSRLPLPRDGPHTPRGPSPLLLKAAKEFACDPVQDRVQPHQLLEVGRIAATDHARHRHAGTKTVSAAPAARVATDLAR